VVPKVRDRLCQIIRQHQLDATLVKSYATDFCGVKSLREATREQIEAFVEQLARLGREGPQCAGLPAQQLHGQQGEGRCRVKRRIQGVKDTSNSDAARIPNGVFLVRVDRAQ